jgi:hypothetical protein
MLEGAPAALFTRLVKRADLAAALPGAVQVTPGERLAQMHARYAGICLRYGL